jgi:hypothetical protein
MCVAFFTALCGPGKVGPDKDKDFHRATHPDCVFKEIRPEKRCREPARVVSASSMAKMNWDRLLSFGKERFWLPQV